MATKRTAKKTAAKRGRGQPKKLASKAVREAVLANIAKGWTLKDACLAEGLDPITLWREDQRDEEFCKALTRARAHQRGVLAERIYAASEPRPKETDTYPGDWRAALEYLRSTYSEEWSPKQQLEHSGDVSVNVIKLGEDDYGGGNR